LVVYIPHAVTVQQQSCPTRCEPEDAGVIPTRNEPGETWKRQLSG
jgi:hypothetical protein